MDFDEMFDGLETMMDAVIARDSLFEKIGKAYKKTLDALLAEGFSREEAVLILAHQGMGVKGNAN